MAGEALLGAAFSVLLERLTSPELVKFFLGRKHDERLLKKLKLKLLGLNKVLNDAEDKQITHRAVKEWLDELKDAVYHAEDLVDEIATEALRCKVEAENQSGPNQVQSLISSFSKLFDVEIESKLERMIDVLEDFMKEKDVLGLREVGGRNWSQTRLPTTSLVDESCVYGRENDKEEIMKLLLSDGESSNGIDVIPVVGMGGVGKTTLAQLLYNDGRLDGHFVKKAWVCVSDVFDVSRVTLAIVEAVTEKACDTKDPNLLAVKLKESLSGKRFLIVLDDVWNENYDNWNALMTPFRFGAQGSKIIITTRNESVASIMQTVPIHGLQKLPEEDCWKLFSKLAFEKGDCNAHPNLERIGKEIVKKCNGLPLAVKTLGGLLRSQRDLKDWNNILESAIWELSEEKSNILPALRLSYHYLPSHLKRCFAYCSTFFKDYEFNMEELVSIWIAEGFLEKPKNNKTVEEEGYECFRELLSRSFFQRSNANDSLYVMHDLVHDLAQYVMGDFCYRLEDGNPHGIAEKVRYFSFVRSRFCSFEKFKEIREATCLRTFLPFKGRGELIKLSKKVVDEILPRLTRLRLLSLSEYGIGELPYSIGNLIHLRFLDLSRAQIRELPESVCTLYNLETLLLFKCDLLTTLPADLVKLISLRHLDLSGTNLKEMPMNISRLKDLQQLTVFVVGKCTGISELGEFHCLRGTISISGLQNVESGNDALEAKMSEKKHLEKLALEWNSTIEDSQNARDVLEKLEPHKTLKHLEIKNYGGTRFPTWLGDQSFCNMVSLHLEKCENCFSLPPLGQMPSLKELTIARMPGITNVGHEFYGESGSLSKPFQSLETLRFEKMSGWVNWCILDAGEFSRLQKLEVSDCPKLIGHLPTNVPSLARLKIVDCPELVASLSRTTSISSLVLKQCQGVQSEWQSVSSVEKLEISGFESLKEFASELVTLTNLKELKIENSSLCVPISEEISQCSMFLERLTLDSCESLKSLQLGLFPKLQSLGIMDCKNFETLLIPDGIVLENVTLLEKLTISNCNNMLSFPCGGLPAPNLSSLILYRCEKLKALPEQMHTLLSSLQSLELSRCPEIESFPEGGLPSKLGHLKIWNCKKLVGGRREWGLQTLPSLTSFSLWGESEDVLESFPEDGLLPPTLTFLHFGDLQNLKSLNKRGLQLLGSLECMCFFICPQLQSFTVERLPTSLLELYVSGCPLLKPRCRRKEGEDWHKIAHIPFITINDEVISE
ncbi:putative disease resistance protein At3g14460 [Rhododendron vialii]|uniref:putative disease resistance protein At3g14460 n=1 Tax=Rhododendron vialii TaxID=182163 RepID=UPI00265EAA98|nr:putative disease resistance protein At3g14460 [Rhododendron vialii]XP_058225822.1 putative disease resistance protein At3g14460 [Rhododendron vialii]XP_058225823.1 putative disease resistance protein At3g14460 [Rhododendron vialii]XP_058225824.1 putative disease resistance protein At3g14460 [Rhododendron vialii]XP_058225826.1 putative disease resistance protein At3g14460 [Rhododendron vialii]XP_058225827.1 putative disease resistance protein At3g14460 [Rhododendron vialii]XP_058225828.1 pu